MQIKIKVKISLVGLLLTCASLSNARFEHTKQELKEIFPHAKESCINDFIAKERRLNKHCSREIYGRLLQKERCENHENGIYLYDEAIRKSYCIIKIERPEKPAYKEVFTL